MLGTLCEVIRETKMTHIRLLKTTLLILHLLQVAVSIQEDESVETLIKEVQMRTRTVMHYSVKHRKVVRRSEGEEMDRSGK